MRRNAPGSEQTVPTKSGAVHYTLASGDASGAMALLKEVVLPYGSGEAELGMVHRPEQEPLGPEAFAIGQDGEIYIADGVRQRVAIYSKEGAYIRSVSLPGVALGDVIGSSTGGVFVYDQTRCALLSYDAEGDLRGALQLSPKDIDTRGFFHAVGDSIYFADAGARDVLVATVHEGQLQTPEDRVGRVAEGIHGASGRLFSVAIEKGAAVRIKLREPAGQGERLIECAVPGVVSARFAGEDHSGTFYLQTERLEGSAVVLDVLAFGRSGERVSETRMPENDYFVWTTKLVDVRRDGAVVQFLPQRSQAKLNIFASQSSPR